MPLDSDTLKEINETAHRIEARFEAMVQQFVRKDEYEARHKRMELDIADLSLTAKQEKKWAMEEHDRLRREQELAHETLRKDWDAVRQGLTKSQLRARDFVISTIVSFLIGGGAIGLITFLLSIYHH